MKAMLWGTRGAIVMAMIAGIFLSSAVSAERLVFVRGGNIWIAGTDGSDERQLTFSGEDGAPALSPDGGTVAYHSGHDGRTGFGRIHLVPGAGGTPRPVALQGMAGAQHPYFLSDGKRIVFVGLSGPRSKGNGDAATTYATMSVAVGDVGSGATRTLAQTRDVLLDAGYVYSSPSVSPDGKMYAYQKSGSDVSGGFVLLDGSGRTVSSFPKVSDPTPFWRPLFNADGKQILCSSPATSEDKKDAIYLVDRQSGRARWIAEGTHATFVDGGTAIVYERWVNKWGENAQSDLWRMDLSPEGKGRKIVTDGASPAGQALIRR